LDLDLLRDFLELAQALNFSRAAELRNMTQPAFSRRIKTLEGEIGTPLFFRTSRSVALTPAGHVLHPRALAILRLSVEARDAALEAAGNTRQSLSLAATHALSFTFVPRWLMQVSGPEELGTLSMISDSQQQCERRILHGEATFFICHRHPRVPCPLPERQFRSQTIGHDTLVPLSAPDASGKPLWPVSQDRNPTPYLSYGAASGLYRILEAHWEENDRPNLATRMSSLLAATNLEMAKEGQGAAWLPASLAGLDVAARRLVRAGPVEFDVSVQIVIFRPRSRLSAHAEQFWRKVGELAAAITHAGSV
jgi:LysR family transcriptional regulator, hypochlorite-specific transcription factor HypT